jgi:hypothetical protein
MPYTEGMEVYIDPMHRGMTLEMQHGEPVRIVMEPPPALEEWEKRETTRF